jgi:hypothetical protein
VAPRPALVGLPAFLARGSADALPAWVDKRRRAAAELCQQLSKCGTTERAAPLAARVRSSRPSRACGPLSLTQRARRSPSDLPAWVVVSAAGFGGLLYWCAIFPVDQVKSAMQTDAIDPAQRRYPTMTAAAKVRARAPAPSGRAACCGAAAAAVALCHLRARPVVRGGARGGHVEGPSRAGRAGRQYG